MTSTHIIAASPFEKLFYELTSAKDVLSVVTSSLKIPHVAVEGSAEYHELTLAAGARICELEQTRKQQSN